MGKSFAKKSLAFILTMVLVTQAAFTGIEVSAAEGAVQSAIGAETAPRMRLWYKEPARESSPEYFNVDIKGTGSGRRNNSGWLNESLAMGNGYMGVNYFGGTEFERIQVTENSLQDSNSTIGGLNSFAEIFIKFDHQTGTSNYIRELDLDTGVAHVSYENGGVKYEREIITSYPDNVMAIKLTADQAGSLDFTLMPRIPWLCEYREDTANNVARDTSRAKTGTVVAENDMITMSGVMEYFGVQYEGQFKVIPTGGVMTASNPSTNALFPNEPADTHGQIEVTGADSAVILFTLGTNYDMENLSRQVVSNSNTTKLQGYAHPHAKVTANLNAASQKTYEELKARHLEDYQELFGRLSLNLGVPEPAIPTNELLERYRNNTERNLYMEELLFQFGRYLLICSSRKGTLPPNLGGKWNVYQDPAWRAGYWHNVNLQMNYWLAFPGNLPELFESYSDFFMKTYMPHQEDRAKGGSSPIASSRRDSTDSGWFIGNSGWPYSSPQGRSAHSGYGTGAWVAMLFWDYYDYTRDEEVLESIVYPVIAGNANFNSRFLTPYAEDDSTVIPANRGKLLANPSSSAENQHEGTSYQTIGATFDQQTMYENHVNTIKAAEILGIDEEAGTYPGDDRPFIQTLKDQLPLMDPIIIGKSGQIKEYREEENYGDIGEYTHRHMSQLLGVYPGQIINPTDSPAWMDAAEVALRERGVSGSSTGTGWATIERVGKWARLYDGETAHSILEHYISTATLDNLFNSHQRSRTNNIWQVDGNFGVTSSMLEMFVHSNDYVITFLPALPEKYEDGSITGVLCRGNFEASAWWANNQAEKFEILSKSGGTCEVRYPDIQNTTVKTAGGETVDFEVVNRDQIKFESTQGETYVITNIPAYEKTEDASNLKAAQTDSANDVRLSWDASADAISYHVYYAVDSSPTYTFAQSVNATNANVISEDFSAASQITFKVVAVNGDERESRGVTTTFQQLLVPNLPENVSGFDDKAGTLTITLDAAEGAVSYNLYKITEEGYELVLNSPYPLMIVAYTEGEQYAVSAVGIVEESEKVAVPITDTRSVGNVLLNKPITADQSPRSSSYLFSLMVDGNTETRMATTDEGPPKSVTVTIDLEGTYALGELVVDEFVNSASTDTRSNQTTFELWDGEAWYTALGPISLNFARSGNHSITTLDLDGQIGSKLRITFINDKTKDGPTIWEVTCEGFSAVGSTDKKALFDALIRANGIDTTEFQPDDPLLIAFNTALRTAEDILLDSLADQTAINEAEAALVSSIDALERRLTLSTDAHNVKKGEYFAVNTSFTEPRTSNAIVLKYSFAGDKFEYANYTAADGVTVVGQQSGDGFAKITLMVPSYNMENLGDISLRAKENAQLIREWQSVSVEAEYVLQDESGQKTIEMATAATSFTTTVGGGEEGGGDNPYADGDTNDDGVVDLIDLSNMIDWFGITNDHSDWKDFYTFFDFNNNGQIDISDIAYVARLIR